MRWPASPPWLRVWITGAVATFGGWIIALILTFVVMGMLKEIFAGKGFIQEGHFEAAWGFFAGLLVVYFGGILIPARICVKSALASLVVLCCTLAPHEWSSDWEFISIIVRPMFAGAALSFFVLVLPAKRRQKNRDAQLLFPERSLKA